MLAQAAVAAKDWWDKAAVVADLAAAVAALVSIVFAWKTVRLAVAAPGVERVERERERQIALYDSRLVEPTYDDLRRVADVAAPKLEAAQQRHFELLAKPGATVEIESNLRRADRTFRKSYIPARRAVLTRLGAFEIATYDHSVTEALDALDDAITNGLDEVRAAANPFSVNFHAILDSGIVRIVRAVRSQRPEAPGR